MSDSIRYRNQGYPTRSTAYRRQRGLGMVELMVSVVLGLILVSAIIQVLLSSKQTFQLEKEISMLQENARFAVEILSREIALAGYTGCRSTARTSIVVNGSGNAANWQYKAPGIEGFDHNQGNAAFPANYRADVATNTDSLIVRSGRGNHVFSVANYAQPSFSFTTGAQVNSAMRNGDILLAAGASCEEVAIFQADSVTASTVSYGAGGTPGNCVMELGTSTATANCVTGTHTGASFVSGSNLMAFQASAFYIGPSAMDATMPALWRMRLINNGGAAELRKEELLQGIENLQILYGYDTDADNVANRFVDANATGVGTWDWKKVVSVRIALLLRSSLPVETEALTNPTFEGIAVPTDRFLRQRVVTTIQLKNHGF